MAWMTICRLAELTEGRGILVRAAGLELAVFLHEGRPHVLDNRCPHAGYSLSEGVIEDRCAVCPKHDWAFDVQSGWLKHSTAVRIATWATRVQATDDGQRLVQADLPEPEEPA